jgi:glycosyltransferase involved in cell wall biosynthesis
MGIAGSRDRDDFGRVYVGRLEAALAGAKHERDLAEERTRLAAEGVEQLERRVEQLRHDLDRERREAERELERHATEAERRREEEVTRERDEAERRHEAELAEARQGLAAKEEELDDAREAADSAGKELAATLARLEAREQHLETAQIGIESRDRRLEAADEALEARGRELKAANASLEAERTELAAARARLELREEELERSRTIAQEAQRELKAAQEQVADREREVEAASTLLEAQGAELARAREAEREVARERDEARARLERREEHLETAQLGVESRDRKLAAAERTAEARQAELSSRDAVLASREAELERLRAAARDRDRRLALAEARLRKAQQRAEHFHDSLVELRGSRAYRLMRVLWRLRRPFRRAPRQEAPAEDESTGDDADSPAAPVADSPPPSLATSSRYRGVSRQAGERLRVAAILDEMSEACFAPECDLMRLSLDSWREQLDERRPDLLLVESAWNGNGGEWQYRIAQYPRKDLVGLPALRELLDGCRERGIPTAFWNKEDPVHFDRFSEAASLFDHVFTTDARCVERYRALPGGERTVTPLPFAAQPRIHNPVAAVPERSSSPCFAGAWYRDRHPDRRRALAALLDAARPYGLVIYDRSFGGKDGAFGFPERFAPHVLGKLPYERILDVYKSHRVFLNANSVVDSPTMCSRRVFELAACDTAILSTPGAALAALLGEGMVEEASDEPTAAAALERLLGDEAERRRRTRAARRAVFAEHTYADRLATIAETAGLGASSLRREPFAMPGASPNGGDPVADDHPWLLVLQPGIALSESTLADLAAAATYADADAIGAHPAIDGGAAIEHRRVSDLDPRMLLLRRELVEQRGHPDGLPEQVRARLREWSDDGVRLYAADADLLPAATPEAIGGPA